MPQKTLILPKIRLALTSTQVLLKTYGSMTRVLFDQLGGFYCAPTRLPEDVDISRPVDVFATISSPLDGTPGAKVVRLALGTTLFTPGNLAANVLYPISADVPSSWALDTPLRFLMDEGSGHTFPGGILEPRIYLGFRITRDGTDSLDTYNQSVDLVDALELVYYQRCQKVCCN